MRNFLSRNLHWILFILVGVSLLLDFIVFGKTKADQTAMVFGMTAFSAVAYLAVVVETKKRREAKGK